MMDSDIITVQYGTIREDIEKTVHGVVEEMCTDRVDGIFGEVFERIIHDLHIQVDEYAREDEIPITVHSNVSDSSIRSLLLRGSD